MTDAENKELLKKLGFSSCKIPRKTGSVYGNALPEKQSYYTNIVVYNRHRYWKQYGGENWLEESRKDQQEIDASKMVNEIARMNKILRRRGI